METLAIVLGVLLLLFLLFLFLIFPATGKREARKAVLYHRVAHRGLFDNDGGIPENSMAAFRRALEHGYGIETDVHLTADGVAVLHHDDSLRRLCGEDVLLRDLTEAELSACRLLGTEEGIPRFSDFLALVDGRVPLVIELKAEKGNHRPLAEAALAVLKDYRGPFCIESFDPRVLQEVRRLAPHVIRGQLSGKVLKHEKNLSARLTNFALGNLLTNVLCRPHFIAYRFGDRRMPAFRFCTAALGATRVYWTLRSLEEVAEAEKDGGIPIFEGCEP